MSDNYSQTYSTSEKALEFHGYRTSSIHQAIIQQETWAILRVDEKASKGFFRNKSVLELGIGHGAISASLGTKIQNLSITGVDVSSSMLRMCKIDLSKDGPQRVDLNLVAGDIFHLPLRSLSSDSALIIRLIPNFRQNDLALQEVARILKPDGQVIFDIYNRISVMALLDNVLNFLLGRQKKTYKHTCDLRHVVGTCESVGLTVKAHVGCLLLGEAFRFVPKQLLHIAMLADRIVSNLPVFSKVSTRIFILASKTYRSLACC